MTTIVTTTSNQDIDYVVKDYNSTVDSLISFATVNFGPGTEANRLWTDFNKSSYSRTWLELVAYTTDILSFYLDQQATQTYLQTATIRSSIQDIAKQFGYVAATATSASGTAQFVLSGAGTIPRGFPLQSSSGSPFYLTTAIVAGAAGTYTGNLLQGVVTTQSFVADGSQGQEFDLIGPNVIIDNNSTNVLDISPRLTVTGNSYALVDSFLSFNGSDTPVVTDSLGDIIGGGGRCFTLSERANGSPFITFGDGIFGRKLIAGEIISITYRSGGGTVGNIEPNSISASSSLAFLTSVTNSAKFSGGTDQQTIEQLRQLIPASLRTLDRAVSETDYSDLITTNFSEVLTASTEANTSDPGIDLNIYVVPNANTITNITDNNLLYTNINSFIDRRKTVTVQFQVLNAFGISVLITLEVFITSTTNKATVQTAIQTILSSYFSLTTGGTNGSGIGFAEEILLKDIYDKISAISGISRLEIKRLTYRPRIDAKIRSLVNTYESTTVQVFPNVSESEWLVAANGPVIPPTGDVLFSNSLSTGFTYDSATGAVVYNSQVDLQDVSPGSQFRNGPGLQEVTELQTVGDGTGAYEVTKVLTRADLQGVEEVTSITTRADVGSNLGGTFFLIYDISGSVAVWFNVGGANTQPSSGANRSIQVNISANDTAPTVATAVQTTLNADAEFNATVLSNVVTATSVTKLSVADAVDGGIPTGFTISTPVQGQTPNSLGGTYFDIYDDVGAVRVWLDTGSSIAPAVPGGGRLLPVTIAPNDSASAVGTAVKIAVDADVKFNATVVSNAVTITVSTVGVKTNASDGALPTGFTITVLTQGAPAVTLDAKYFILSDVNGDIAYWYALNNGPTVEPSHGAPRSVKITTVNSGDTANTVASATSTAIAAGIAEVRQALTVADVSGNLNNKYFLVNSALNTIKYYVWYNVSGAGVDPAVPGRTGLVVNLVTNDSSNSVATKTRAAINTLAPGSFSATGAANTVIITNVTAGVSDDIADATTPNGTTFTFSNTIQGASFSTAVALNVITITAYSKASIDPALAGTSGFTATITVKGVGDNTDFYIFAVNNKTSSLYLLEGQPVNPIAGSNAGGSIRSGTTSYESFKVFKKTTANATNLSVDSITDSSLDLSIATGTAASLSTRTLIDNTKVFVPNQYSTGNFYLVDGAGNIWVIVANDSNTITTAVSAVNDAAITLVSPGDYKIVTKLVGQILFNSSIFNIQYNSHNTIVSIGAEFTQIGTIGDNFEISAVQNNIGDLGIPVDIISYNSGTGEVRLNNSPNLSGVSSNNLLVDSSGQSFAVVGIDDRTLPEITYSNSNQNSSVILKSSGLGVSYSQGFKVTQTDVYSVVSAYLLRVGNIVGHLSAKIVKDDGTGLPDLGQLVSLSNLVNVTDVANSGYSKVSFSFATAPTLVLGTQYHLVIITDSAYQTAQQSNVLVFNNSGPVSYSYNIISGVIQYAASVNLSTVSPGNFFQDNDGTLFTVLSVDDANDTVTVATGLTLVTGINGNIYADDSIYMSIDNTSPSYSDGETSIYNGAVWSNSTLGPSPLPSLTVAPFSIQGPKSITVESNLTPVLGAGGTVSSRYYDDSNEITFSIGISNGTPTAGIGVNALALATVSGIPNTLVDHFIFRTSRYADDVVNLRKNEIPQLSLSDLVVNIFGGIG